MDPLVQVDTRLSITNPPATDSWKIHMRQRKFNSVSPSDPHNGGSDDITQPLHELTSQNDALPTSDADHTANSAHLDTKFPPIPPTVSSPSLMGAHSHRILLDICAGASRPLSSAILALGGDVCSYDYIDSFL